MASLVPFPAFAALLACLRPAHDLPPADQALLRQALRYRTLPAGYYLCQPGQVCRELFFIYRGVLRVVVPLEAERELTYFFAQQNQLCTILDSFVHQRPALEGLQAACATQVLELSHRALLRLAQQLPYLPDLLGGMAQSHLLRILEQRNQALREPLATRQQQFTLAQPALAHCVAAPALAAYLGLTLPQGCGG